MPQKHEQLKMSLIQLESTIKTSQYSDWSLLWLQSKIVHFIVIVFFIKFNLLKWRFFVDPKGGFIIWNYCFNPFYKPEGRISSLILLCLFLKLLKNTERDSETSKSDKDKTSDSKKDKDKDDSNKARDDKSKLRFSKENREKIKEQREGKDKREDRDRFKQSSAKVTVWKSVTRIVTRRCSYF